MNVIGRFDHAERHSLFATTSAKPDAGIELVRLGRCNLAHERRGRIGARSPQRQGLDLAPRPVDQDRDLGAGDQACGGEPETLARKCVHDLEDALCQLPCDRDRLWRVMVTVRHSTVILRPKIGRAHV